MTLDCGRRQLDRKESEVFPPLGRLERLSERFLFEEGFVAMTEDGRDGVYISRTNTSLRRRSMRLFLEKEVKVTAI